MVWTYYWLPRHLFALYASLLTLCLAYPAPQLIHHYASMSSAISCLHLIVVEYATRNPLRTRQTSDIRFLTAGWMSFLFWREKRKCNLWPGLFHGTGDRVCQMTNQGPPAEPCFDSDRKMANFQCCADMGDHPIHPQRRDSTPFRGIYIGDTTIFSPIGDIGTVDIRNTTWTRLEYQSFMT